MRLDQRSFSGSSFRPSPITHYEKSVDLLMVATGWGEQGVAQTVIDKIKDFIQLSQDPEATVVGIQGEALAKIESRMRSAAQLANEFIYKTDNAKEYKAAVELALLSMDNKMLHWAQIGGPHILLSTPNGLEPICYTPDWSWQLEQSAPLVGQALGMEKTCHLNCGSYRLMAGQKIILVSRSHIPARLYGEKNIDLHSLSRILVDDNPEVPFWAAVIEV